ncbi:MAG: phenylalanine--tRNA ligase subunit alpha [Parcubacteria group bacterium]|jgi:phenylalanyl-tRNA synthetase alpha chain
MNKADIKQIEAESAKEIAESQDAKQLYDVKVKYLGRKGRLTEILKKLRDLDSEERKSIGPLANGARQLIDNGLDKRKKELENQIDWEKEKIDVTLPGEKNELGSLNSITIVYREIEQIFSSMGFEITSGPELETDWYNFTALNFPPDHPARDMQDTFWIHPITNPNHKMQMKIPSEGEAASLSENNLRRNGGGIGAGVKSDKEKLVLRTHTSPVQVRYMEKHKPPFRVIVPGRVFRNEATDATHEHTLHQFEALVTGKDINIGHFKHIAKEFFSAFFGKDVDIRLRPSFFPFTEPSFEFDISCTVCSGKGCPSCRYGKWLEIGGAGMVNQNVFMSAGYPRNKFQGFAWGFGIERLAMMKYKIDDIRWFESGDLRFIKQF